MFTFHNHMKLESGDVEDKTFQFPTMNWDIMIRYNLFSVAGFGDIGKENKYIITLE